jgi:drug/metabolite transporter (DMT)-like permease
MEKKHFFDKPENVKKVLRAFWGVLIVLLVIDFFIPKHPHFPWEEWPGFYAAFGFVAFVGLILVAKYILRPLIKRKEDYYD